MRVPPGQDKAAEPVAWHALSLTYARQRWEWLNKCTRARLLSWVGRWFARSPVARQFLMSVFFRGWSCKTRVNAAVHQMGSLLSVALSFVADSLPRLKIKTMVDSFT